MPTIRLKYGRTHADVELCSGNEVLSVMPNEIPPVRDFEKVFLASLDHPLFSLSLGELARQNGSKPVVIVANDPTRLANSEQFLPLLVDYLGRAGVPDRQMSIVFACGSHRPMSDSEMGELVGPEVKRRIACHNHVATDGDSLVYYGETSFGTPVWLNRRVADAGLRVLTGSIVHHFFAGFGGGRKALVPGVAGHATIQKNHSMMLQDGAEIGRLEGNPVHLDLLEAARMVGGGFLVNVVLNEAHEFAGVFAGDMEEAHEAGCALVERANGVLLPWQADVVIAGCGGHPKDINVYQAQKTLDNAAQAVRQGGQIVLLAQCPDGVGSETYHDWARKYKTLPELETALRADFVLGGHKAYAVARLLARATVQLVSGMPQQLVEELGFTYAASAQQAADRALDAAGLSCRVLVMPEGSITVPAKH